MSAVTVRPAAVMLLKPPLARSLAAHDQLGASSHSYPIEKRTSKSRRHASGALLEGVATCWPGSSSSRDHGQLAQLTCPGRLAMFEKRTSVLYARCWGSHCWPGPLQPFTTSLRSSLIPRKIFSRSARPVLYALPAGSHRWPGSSSRPRRLQLPIPRKAGDVQRTTVLYASGAAGGGSHRWPGGPCSEPRPVRAVQVALMSRATTHSSRSSCLASSNRYGDPGLRFNWY
jgi:hypothetical protein